MKRIQYKNKKLFFMVLFMITFLYGKLQGGFVSWFLFYSLLTLMIYIWLVERYALRGVKVERIFSKSRLTAGDDLEIEIRMTNQIGFPLSYLMIIDHLPEKIESNRFIKNKHLIYPWFRNKVIVPYKIPQVKRGVHHWGKIQLETGDLFGLLKVRKEFFVSGEVLVYPKTIPIQYWNSRNEKNAGAAFAQHRASEDASSVIGVREYRIGDRFHRIHWKQTAKTRQLMTKEFERFITNDFMVMINQENHASLIEQPERFERMVELTASLVRYATDQRFMVGLLAEGKSRKVTRLARGTEHVMKIYEILAMAEADAMAPFDHTVIQEVAYLPYGTTVVLITPIIDQAFYRMLSKLAIRKMKVEVFLVQGGKEDQSLFSEIDSLRQLGIAIHLISDADWENINDGGLLIG